MTSPAPGGPPRVAGADRARAARRLERLLLSRSHPRLQMTLLLSATGLAGFLTSKLLHALALRAHRGPRGEDGGKHQDEGGAAGQGRDSTVKPLRLDRR